MNTAFEKFEEISKRQKAELERGNIPKPERMTVRQLLGLFYYERRGSWINGYIRHSLDKHDLRTVPDFEFTWLDITISIELDPEVIEGITTSEVPSEPTIRVGIMEAANRKPISVRPDNPLSVATTIMQTYDYSQLPVMESERDVKGVISWKSIGMRFSMGQHCENVRDCMDTQVPIIDISAPLFNSVHRFMQNGYFLVRDEKDVISGIVTSSDFANQFNQHAGPFLIIGEIEGYLRILVHRKFTVDEMNDALSKSGIHETVSGPEDLTLGGYCQLLGQEEHWKKLNMKFDRKVFVKELDWVRKRRNDVMHFNPEGLEPKDVERLENFAKFFRNLRRMSII